MFRGVYSEDAEAVKADAAERQAASHENRRRRQLVISYSPTLFSLCCDLHPIAVNKIKYYCISSLFHSAKVAVEWSTRCS